MATVALVSVTLNAVNPMTRYFGEKNPALRIENYLDSHLLGKVKKEGGIRPGSMKRMFDMLAEAAEDGADVILLTCTIFSPYAQQFSELLGKPVICSDRSMLETVAGNGGRTAIICTFTGTVETTKNLYLDCCRKAGVPETVDMYVAEGALDAVERQDFAAFDRLIQEKARELDQDYDQVVLAQISMARAAKGLEMKHAKLFTSPDSAYEAVMEALSVV